MAEEEAGTTDPEAEADARLWAGAWAAGWRVKGCASKGHYMYTAPDGRSFGSKRAALEAAGHAAASSARAALTLTFARGGARMEVTEVQTVVQEE